jgi:hypothetical protein
MKLSFCVITIGSQPEKLNYCLKSIENNFIDSDIEYEITLVGNNIPKLNYKNLKIIEDTKYVKFLGKRKNIATENSSGDILIHCDDDIIFCQEWLKNFLSFYSKNKNWKILGNKILLPDGFRYWDRNTYLPKHTMVDYDYESNSDIFYQTGCFSVCQKDFLQKNKWDETLPFYAQFNGFEYNEDVEFSLRINKKGIMIDFDKNNTVWHYDHSYRSDNVTCNKNTLNSLLEPKCKSFIKILNNITNEDRIINNSHK